MEVVLPENKCLFCLCLKLAIILWLCVFDDDKIQLVLIIFYSIGQMLKSWPEVLFLKLTFGPNKLLYTP